MKSDIRHGHCRSIWARRERALAEIPVIMKSKDGLGPTVEGCIFYRVPLDWMSYVDSLRSCHDSGQIIRLP